MGAFDSIVNVTVRLGSVSFDRVGFGTPLILGYTTKFAELAKTYASPVLKSMEDDGFVVEDPIYKIAQMVLRQENAPKQIVVGRLITAYDHDTTFTPINVVAGFVYSFTITVFNRADDTETSAEITYTNDATPTVAEACAGLVTAINGSALASLLTATDNTTSISVSSDVIGNLIEYTAMPSHRDMSVLEATAYASLGTQISALQAINDDWYCILSEVSSDAIGNAIGDWVAAETKVALLKSADSGILLSGTTTDIASDLKADENDRASVWYSPEVTPYLPAAVAGLWLPTDPGEATTVHKKLRGVPATALNGSETAVADGKYANYYQRYTSSLALTRMGRMASGKFVHTRREIDWLVARCQEALVALLASSPKVPYTTAGISRVKTALEGVVATAIANDVLSPGTPDSETDPVPVVTVPSIEDVPAEDKASGTLNNVVVSGVLAGAIVTINITLQLTE